MADMVVRIQPSQELEEMIRRLAQEAIQDIRTGRGQKGKGLYPVTAVLVGENRVLMVDADGESHWVLMTRLREAETKGWTQAFTLTPRPAPAPREVPDVMARATRRARGGRGETDAPPAAVASPCRCGHPVGEHGVDGCSWWEISVPPKPTDGECPCRHTDDMLINRGPVPAQNGGYGAPGCDCPLPEKVSESCPLHGADKTPKSHYGVACTCTIDMVRGVVVDAESGCPKGHKRGDPADSRRTATDVHECLIKDGRCLIKGHPNPDYVAPRYIDPEGGSNNVAQGAEAMPTVGQWPGAQNPASVARSFDRATEAGAREALLAVKEELDVWVAQSMVEDEANGRRDRITDPELYPLHPDDIRTIVTDVARRLGVKL